MNNADKTATAQPVTLDAYCFNGHITVASDHDTDYMGLTKREHFAGLAMQGLMSDEAEYLKWSDLAKDSVAVADALLKALEVGDD